MKYTIFQHSNIKSRNISNLLSEPIELNEKVLDFNNKKYSYIKKFYNKIHNKKNRIVIAPTGSGKSSLIKYLAANDAIKNNCKIIICVPQNIIATSFLDAGSIINVPGIKNAYWNPESFCGQINTVQKLESFLQEYLFPGWCDNIRVTTHQTLVALYKKGNINLFKNCSVFIDEAHHISTDDNGKNILGQMIDELIGLKNNVRFTLTTATFNRGDQAQILNDEILKKHFPEDSKCFLPWDEYIGTLNHIKNIKYSISFYKNNYIEQFCKDKPAKSILYLPITGSPYSVTGTPKGDAKRIVNKLKNKTIVDLATPELQRGNEKLLLEYKNVKGEKDDCYPANVLLAVGKIKEGFNWKPASTVAIVGNKTSATEIIQIMGRALRDHEGKDTVEVIHYFPYPFGEVKENNVKERINGFFNIIALSMIFDSVFSTELKLPYQKKKKGVKGRVKRVVNVLAGVLDESNELAFYNDVMQRAMVVLDSLGAEATKAEQFKSFKEVVQEAMDERGLKVSAERIAEFIWVKHTQKVLNIKGIDSSRLSFIEMIDEHSPLDFYKTLFNGKFGELRDIVHGNSITIEDCRKLAEERGGKCLDKRYINSSVKMNWICSKKHEWQASFSSLKFMNTWCPYCYGRIVTLEDCQNLANIKNGKCLNKEYINARYKMSWKCGNNHIWKAPSFKIREGDWCPFCASNSKKTIIDCQQAAEKRGGKCLSKKYINSTFHIEWQCKCKYVFKASYRKVNNGFWCVRCKQANKKTYKICINGHQFIGSNCKVCFYK